MNYSVRRAASCWAVCSEFRCVPLRSGERLASPRGDWSRHLPAASQPTGTLTSHESRCRRPNTFTSRQSLVEWPSWSPVILVFQSIFTNETLFLLLFLLLCRIRPATSYSVPGDQSQFSSSSSASYPQGSPPHGSARASLGATVGGPPGRDKPVVKSRWRCWPPCVLFLMFLCELFFIHPILFRVSKYNLLLFQPIISSL